MPHQNLHDVSFGIPRAAQNLLQHTLPLPAQSQDVAADKLRVLVGVHIAIENDRWNFRFGGLDDRACKGGSFLWTYQENIDALTYQVLDIRYLLSTEFGDR
jgi:hypothetical protein